MTLPDPHRHPAWFGAVMGTGALALTFAAEATAWQWAWLTTVAGIVLLAASLLAVALLPRYVRRLGDRAALGHELADPGHGPMLATVPAGVLVLAVGWGRIGPELLPTSLALWIDAVLLVVGAVLAVVFGLAWSATILRETPGLEGVNGGWLIPPVMNMLVPLALAPLMVANPSIAPLLAIVGFAFLGVGTVLFLALLPLLIARLALRTPLPAAMAPSLWIPLAPAGVVGLSTLRLLQAATEAEVSGFNGATAGVVIAAMGVGFGLWWAAFAAVELRRIRRADGPPLHPGWWGFVFPIAAMTLSTAAIGAAMNVWLIEVLGLIATVGLTGLWLFVVARTARLLPRRRQQPT